MSTSQPGQDDLSDKRAEDDHPPSPRAGQHLLADGDCRSLAVVVLAGGEGRRFGSRQQKVLHPVCGVPMIEHVLAAVREFTTGPIIVATGLGSDEVRARATGPTIEFVETPAAGHSFNKTGGAELMTRLADYEHVLFVYGSAPLVTAEQLRAVAEAPGEMALLVTDEGDAAGVYRNRVATTWGGGRSGRLIDVVAGFQGGRPSVTPIDYPAGELTPVATRADLAETEAAMRSRLLHRLMDGGVTIVDPATTYVDAGVRAAQDVRIEPNTYLYGETVIGEGAVIGPGSTLRDARIGAACTVAQSVVEDSVLGERVSVGPFSHVRGGAEIGDDCYLGNYAEVKNSRLGRGVKMHHFSYIGDADVGDEANIAAGVITCNYDGIEKHRTTIGERAFIGCDTMLVAPVTVGAGAQTGAGSVVNRDIPPGALAVGTPARIRQRSGRDRTEG